MLVGRDHEMRTITRLVAGARLGEGAALLLLGEPGVGKTTLLSQAVADLGGAYRLLRATGTGSEHGLAFAGLSQLLMPILDGLSEIPAPQADALAVALALREGPPGDRLAIGAATLSLISLYAEQGPVAVVVDDAHLLDGPTLDALAFTARRLHADRVILLAAARAPELGDALGDLPRLELTGLDAEAARELLERSSGGSVSADRFAEVYRLTAGNPLALCEVGTDLDALETDVTGLPLTAPGAVTRTFSRRLGQLTLPARVALLVAAVAGGDLGLTARACRLLDQDVALIAEAEDTGLVTLAEGRVEFRHPLLSAATYAGAPAADRHAAHRAVAEALPATDPDRRAWHLAAAAWGPDAQVADLLAAVGARAFARSGYSAASSAYQRAATLSPTDEDRAARWLRAAEAAWAAGAPDRVVELLDELRLLEVSPVVADGALELRAAVAARSGQLREARDMLLAAAADQPVADRAVVLLADAAHASFYLGDTATTLLVADRLERLTPQVTTERARALGLMASGIGRVLGGCGGADEIRAAAPLLESSLDLVGDPRRVPWLMLAPLFLRESSEGRRLPALVEEVRGAVGVGTLPAVLFHLARDQATTDAWSRADANFTEAIRLARETGQTTELAASLAGRCCLASRRGDETGCHSDADEALQLCRERSIHLAEAWVLFALGDLELSLGEAGPAAATLGALVALLTERGMDDPDLSPCPELVDALVRSGDPTAAARLPAAYLAAADDKGQPWARARARRAVGMVAADSDVDGVFGEALGLHEQTLDSFETARTRLAFGERLRRAGRRVDARAQLREALSELTALGADRWSHRAAAELAATGETVQRVETGWRAALTPQELQVALLLADGRTTREAAASLFLSPKTVEYHLRKTYAKLGIHSREELSAAVAELAGGAD